MKPETVKQVAQVVEPIQEEVHPGSESPKTPDGSLTQAALAERLKVNTSNVGRAWKKRGEEGFRTWSKEKDPDSIAWRYCEETKRYLRAE